MINILAESSIFSRRQTDQVRMRLKKGWFSDLEIVEIFGRINSEEYEQDPPTRIETLNIKKQEPLNRIETQNTKK